MGRIPFRRLRNVIIAAGLIAVPTLVVGGSAAHAGLPTCGLTWDKSSYEIHADRPSENIGTLTVDTFMLTPSAVLWIRADSLPWLANPVASLTNGAQPVLAGSLAALLATAGVPAPADGSVHTLDLAIQTTNVTPYDSGLDLCAARVSITYHGAAMPATGSKALPMMYAALALFGAGAVLMAIRRARVRTAS
jgi:hypothetical protein